ncbi:MAG TPA: hypothetical protein VFP54_09725, partial [Acidimicrobiales bacterium]|nr:hypothetical protein [Acidimicrobiales bacterium]
DLIHERTEPPAAELGPQPELVAQSHIAWGDLNEEALTRQRQTSPTAPRRCQSTAVAKQMGQSVAVMNADEFGRRSPSLEQTEEEGAPCRMT